MPKPRKQKPNRSDNRYEVKITTGRGIDGKLYRKSFYSTISKADAQRQADEYKIKTAVNEITGLPSINKSVPFTELSQLFLDIKKSQVKEYTYFTTYKTKVEKYIDPYFGKADIRSVKRADVDKFFIKYSDLSESMLKKLKLILVNIFDLAIENDYIYKNVAKKAVIAGKKPVTRRTYSADQKDKIYKYCVENNIVDIAILLETGIRRSELLGLTWDKIDLKNNVIYITSAVTPEEGTAVEGDPKSASGIRAIPIVNQPFADFLKSNTGTGYIVKGKSGGFMSPSGYAKRFKETLTGICSQLQIPALTPHELRHTFGTLHHANGVDILTISKVMGHAEIGITSKFYVHDDIEALRNGMKPKIPSPENKDK